MTYGFVKCTVVTAPVLTPSHVYNETQYHLHVSLSVPAAGATQTWDTAINVGTNNAGDLLQYRIATDYAHPVVATLKAAAAGFSDRTGTQALPALDFLRSDVLAKTSN